MKIYTKYGDQGNTQLLGGQTTTKDDLRVDTCGALDEFSAALGLVGCTATNSDLNSRIQKIQANLLTLGANVASLGGKSTMALPSLAAYDIKDIEQHIDELQDNLPPLTNFVLPGGSLAAAQMHFARTVCRRAERGLVATLKSHGGADPVGLSDSLIYVNRLSDWCFVVARYLNKLDNVDEILWKG